MLRGSHTICTTLFLEQFSLKKQRQYSSQRCTTPKTLGNCFLLNYPKKPLPTTDNIIPPEVTSTRTHFFTDTPSMSQQENTAPGIDIIKVIFYCGTQASSAPLHWAVLKYWAPICQLGTWEEKTKYFHIPAHFRKGYCSNWKSIKQCVFIINLIQFL